MPSPACEGEDSSLKTPSHAADGKHKHSCQTFLQVSFPATLYHDQLIAHHKPSRINQQLSISDELKRFPTLLELSDTPRPHLIER
mmetsp:Transcript_36259/g.60034  ORF Transcript_36259/g.60034 Transcript_36259/m.60034 type:complete len:85 (-) Transcript_36259:535-789(-)